MRNFDKQSLMKFSPLLILSIVFLILGFLNPPLFKGDNSEKISTKKVTEKVTPEIKTASDSSGENSVKVNLNNSTSINGSQGTCTVTKNGKTETVPAGSVNVNEKSSGDVNVKVDCNSSSTSSNHSSIKSNVDVQVNTSN